MAAATSQQGVASPAVIRIGPVTGEEVMLKSRAPAVSVRRSQQEHSPGESIDLGLSTNPCMD